jgi:uncharacterized protein (TIGR02001 family)
VAGLLLALALSAVARPAAAQLRGSVAIVSDDRFRGRSVSAGRPALSLDLVYDAPNGLYGGLAASGVASRRDGLQPLSLQEYVGYARRLPAGPTLDLGATHTNYSEYYHDARATAYTELYAGLVTRRFVTHLYYSPDYFGRDLETLYGEVDTAVRPGRGWRLSAHVGVLGYLSSPPGFAAAVQYDWRLGVATAVKGFELEAAWSGAGPAPGFYAGAARGRSGAALALRRRF